MTAKTYHLLCFSCREYLDLGKLFWPRDGEALDAMHVSGVYLGVLKTWHQFDEFFGKTLVAFLVLHRNHEIRFVPEGVDEFISGLQANVPDVEPEDILVRAMKMEPNAPAELEAWRLLLKRE